MLVARQLALALGGLVAAVAESLPSEIDDNLLAPFAGVLGDRVDRRKVLIIVLTLLALPQGLFGKRARA